MEEYKSKIQIDPERLKGRFETIVSIFEKDFLPGLKESSRSQIYLNKELLHCAIKAYFDDIERYKLYAGSEYADSHKQAAYTIKWINKFRPIQIKENAVVDTAILTINATFALTVGFIFLDRSVVERMTDKFFRHLVYILTYRNWTGKSLSTLMYAIECSSMNKPV